MRALVIADVHANQEALRAVLADAGARGGFDAVWCLGDTVGYGAEPDECVALIEAYPHEAVAGNHDLAAIGAVGTEDFNPHAAAAAAWTAMTLNDASRQWLTGLPSVREVAGEFTLTHGSLVDPVWDYLVYPEVAAEHLGLQMTAYGFVGHSHLPLLFREGVRMTGRPGDGERVSLDGGRFVANPGSVGQPRDGDPRAAYAIVNTEAAEVSFHRVEWDVASAQAKIREAGLPEVLAARLAVGR